MHLPLCRDRDVIHVIDELQLWRVVCHLHLLNHGRLVLHRKRRVDNLVWKLLLWDLRGFLGRLHCWRLHLLKYCNILRPVDNPLSSAPFEQLELPSA